MSHARVHVLLVLVAVGACGVEPPADPTVGGEGGGGGRGATKADGGGTGGAGGEGGATGGKQDAGPANDTRAADRPVDRKQGETNPEFPPCTTTADCPSTHYCIYGANGLGCRATDAICSPRKVDIYCQGDPTGFCVKRYERCVPADTKACGCDGKTYESNCVMVKDFGVVAANQLMACEDLAKL